MPEYQKFKNLAWHLASSRALFCCYRKLRNHHNIKLICTPLLKDYFFTVVGTWKYAKQFFVSRHFPGYIYYFYCP